MYSQNKDVLDQLERDYLSHAEMTLLMRIHVDVEQARDSSANIPKDSELLSAYKDISAPFMDSTMIYCDEAIRLALLGNYDGAEAMFQRCIYIREVKFGRNSGLLSPILFLHADFLFEVGKRKNDLSKLDLSCLEVERCIAIASALNTIEDESMARYLTKLGQIHLWKGEKYRNTEDMLRARVVLLNLLNLQMDTLGKESIPSQETANMIEAINTQLVQWNGPSIQFPTVPDQTAVDRKPLEGLLSVEAMYSRFLQLNREKYQYSLSVLT